MVHKDPEGYVSDSDSASATFSDDNDYGDWRSDDSNPTARTLALFPGPDGQRASFGSPLEALQDAKAKGFDLVRIVKEWQLDTLEVIRLINYVRRNGLSAEQVNGLKGDGGWRNDDDELKPVEGYEDDGLLQVDFDLLEEEGVANKDLSKDQVRIRELEQQLATARSAFDELRSIHASSLGLSSTDLTESSSVPLTEQQRSTLASSSLSTSAARTRRGANDAEDDILYFDSYSTNSIHQTMITDSARTLSYAAFLLAPENSHLIRGKVVMDVGCGTGILSMFAARAGAKQVIAIDASAIVERAQQNIEANGFGHIIKVHRGKLEDLTSELAPYEGKVDLLVSEWMGYFLLYENMLPSVLVARDRYLSPTGVLAPNRMTMHLAAFSSPALLQTKLTFWDDVHGFDMKAMTTGLLEEAFVDVLDKEEVVSDSQCFADLNLPKLPAKQPEPESDFTLTVEKDVDQVHGFISWFDTFFFPSSTLTGTETVDCPPFNLTEKDVPGMELKGNTTTQEKDAGKGKMICFSTSPFSKETHWQQTLFVLKTPIVDVKKGDKIKGRIVVRQDTKHSRQLEAELHYLHVAGETSGVEKGKKKVETQLVQVFMVR